MVIESQSVRQYFRQSAVPFDALYSERAMNPIVRRVNQILRFGVYQRYILLMDHLRRTGAKSVLDIGCGSGRYAVGAQQEGVRRYVGIDFSDEMIELARDATKETVKLMDQCEFICADFMDTELDQTFDVVSAMGVFDYIRQPYPVLLKMSTLATYSVVGSFPGWSLYRSPLRWLRLRLRNCPVYFYSRRHIDVLAQAAGFSRHEVIKMKGPGAENFVVFYK